MENTVTIPKTVNAQDSWSYSHTVARSLGHLSVRVLAPSMRERACGAGRSFPAEPATRATLTTIDAFPGTTAWGPPT